MTAVQADKYETVGVTFPFKDLKEDDAVRITLTDGRIFNVEAFPRPVKKPKPEKSDLHHILFTTYEMFDAVSRVSKTLGSLQTHNMSLNPEEIPLKDFTLILWKKITGSLEGNPFQRIRWDGSHEYTEEVSYVKIEKVVKRAKMA